MVATAVCPDETPEKTTRPELSTETEPILEVPE
jgi:hypothetical protein